MVCFCLLYSLSGVMHLFNVCGPCVFDNIGVMCCYADVLLWSDTFFFNW